MSIQVSTTTIATEGRGIRSCLRFSSGTPFVVVPTGGSFERGFMKGNSVTPSSFSTFYNPLISEAHPKRVGMISGTLAGFLKDTSSGMSDILELYDVNESGTVNNQTVQTYDLLPSGSYYPDYDFAIDSAGKIHVIYNDSVSSMGTEYLTLYYTNNISGSWSTPLEIFGVSATDNIFQDFLIQIDSLNRPFVKFQSNSNGHKWARGNNNNPTSFALGDMPSVNYGGYRMFSDEDGDHWYFGFNSNDLYIAHHDVADFWQTADFSETIISNVEFNEIYGVECVGNYAYVFHKDQTNNPNGYSVTKIDISGINPTYVSTDNLTTDDPFEWDYNGRSLWKATPRYHNYDSGGTDNGVADNGQDLDFIFNRTSGNKESYWDVYSLVSFSAGSKIKVSSWKDIVGMQINIGGTWKTVTAVKQNIGGVWKDVTI